MPYLGEIALTRRTWAAGTWGSGVFSKGAPTETSMRGAWRPMAARDAQLLELGDRERDPRTLITGTELQLVRQGTGLVSDHVSPDAGTTWYEVISKQDGTAATAMLAPGVNAWRYTLLRVMEADG